MSHCDIVKVVTSPDKLTVEQLLQALEQLPVRVISRVIRLPVRAVGLYPGPGPDHTLARRLNVGVQADRDHSQYGYA